MSTTIKIDERVIHDPLIAPTVKALAALGIGVYAASEGSLNNGIAAPWVDIENLASDPHLGTKIISLQKQIQQQKSKGIKPLALITKLHHAYNQERRPNLRLQQKMITLLDNFYQQRQVDFDSKLHLSEIFSHGGCRLESQGANVQALRPKRKKQQYLQIYQQEMQAFTTYLQSLLPKNQEFEFVIVKQQIKSPQQNIAKH